MGTLEQTHYAWSEELPGRCVPRGRAEGWLSALYQAAVWRCCYVAGTPRAMGWERPGVVLTCQPHGGWTEHKAREAGGELRRAV